MASPVLLSNVDAYLEDSRLPTDPGYFATLPLVPSRGYVPQRFNPGFPEVRDVSDKKPSQNGTYDFTKNYGARGVTLEVAIARELQDDPTVSDQSLEDQLRKWMAPNLRPYLYIKHRGETTYRRVKLRSANLGSPLSFITKRDFRTVSMSWKGIDGVFEAGTLSTETLQPAVAVELGRAYDLAFDRTYPAAGSVGPKNLRNEGSTESAPIVTVYGPITQPRIENQTSGQALEFLAAYALAAGEYLVIDFGEGTVYLNGDPTLSRYDKIDFASGISKWWTLNPGDNFVRFYPLVSAAPAQATVQWRSKYL